MMMQDRATVTMECESKTVPKLSDLKALYKSVIIIIIIIFFSMTVTDL